MIQAAYFHYTAAPKQNRSPFTCEQCGERAAWNQRRTGRNSQGDRIEICRRCNGGR